jgi:hypothetical protein
MYLYDRPQQEYRYLYWPIIWDQLEGATRASNMYKTVIGAGQTPGGNLTIRGNSALRERKFPNC